MTGQDYPALSLGALWLLLLPLPTLTVAADVGLSPLGCPTAPGRLNSASEAAENMVERA